MMGTRSASGSGTDALAGLLAIISDPEKTAARFAQLSEEQAKIDTGWQELHGAQQAHQVVKTEHDGLVRDLERRERELAERMAEHSTAVLKLEADSAAMVKRAGEFEERDRVRDAKAAAERAAIKEERAALEQERELTAAAKSVLEAERAVVVELRAGVDAEHTAVVAQAARLAETFDRLSAIINGDLPDAPAR